MQGQTGSIARTEEIKHVGVRDGLVDDDSGRQVARPVGVLRVRTEQANVVTLHAHDVGQLGLPRRVDLAERGLERRHFGVHDRRPLPLRDAVAEHDDRLGLVTAVRGDEPTDERLTHRLEIGDELFPTGLLADLGRVAHVARLRAADDGGDRRTDIFAGGRRAKARRVAVLFFAPSRNGKSARRPGD